VARSSFGTGAMHIFSTSEVLVKMAFMWVRISDVRGGLGVTLAAHNFAFNSDFINYTSLFFTFCCLLAMTAYLKFLNQIYVMYDTMDACLGEPVSVLYVSLLGNRGT